MQYITDNESRRRKVVESATINGIDYLEVLDLELVGVQDSLRQKKLRLHFLKSLDVAIELTKDNVRIEGGQRIRDIEVVDVVIDTSTTDPVDGADVRGYVEVELDKAGDFSEYTLRLVRDRRSDEPPEGIDRILSSVAFSFKVECPNEFDCEEDEVAIAARPQEPAIDYLVKDYQSFRRLMLDRMTSLVPEWTERNAADTGVAVVELLAYTADYMSYYQDAVSTEAYLGTARRRVSVRRHARVLDYPMHDGCNARTWVALQVDTSVGGQNAEGAVLPVRTQLLTKIEGEGDARIASAQIGTAVSRGARVFETMFAIEIKEARNELEFYTWGETRAVLPAGATSAVLKANVSATEINLKAGDVLIFEEKRSPESGRTFDANPNRRHAVRLERDGTPGTDDLYGEDYIEIEWYKGDALPFDLFLGDVETESATLAPITVAYANVVLADHGRTIPDEDLIPAEVPEDTPRYRPELRLPRITQRQPYSNETALRRAAGQATVQDTRLAEPAVRLYDDDEEWTARPDLLNSDRFSTDFVVETEDDGRAVLRFGDNVLGKRPPAGTRFQARYRIGNGRSGNIGARSLAHVVVDDPDTELIGLSAVFNPLPASGGYEPESIDQVKLYAPTFFKSQERAVTEEDYVRIAERHPEVQKAQATLRWTGSWHTVFLSIDREGGLDVDDAFKEELRAFIDPYRLTGHDLEIEAPNFVGLDIILRVQVQDGYLKSTVKESLLELFSSEDLPDGSRGFFHPDNYTFGEPVYLSNIIAAAMETTGVERVDTVRFVRFGVDVAPGEVTETVTEGLIEMERLEIVRVDNDQNAPENGKIEFLMEGGL